MVGHMLKSLIVRVLSGYLIMLSLIVHYVENSSGWEKENTTAGKNVLPSFCVSLLQ